MPLELGGRADKAGNKYEINSIIYELLKVISEDNYSIIIEALGDDEIGTDILVTSIHGIKEHQQCKASNASKEYWDLVDLKSRNILQNWKYQLSRDEKRQVSLISPVGCKFMVDLHDRAMNTSSNFNDFYEFQIKRSSKEFWKFYENFCIGMGLETSNQNDIIRSIDLLQRINLKQISEYTLRESIQQKIGYYFCSDKEVVYNALLTLIINGDILGKEISATVLYDYFTEKKIYMRLLDRDKRLMPQISVLNQEYRRSFKSLKEGLIHRTEFNTCIDAIQKEQSFIISGNAGYGKSGCTEAILSYCESNHIPHIALKLDRKIPRKSCEIWGNDLGFPCSIAYALDSVSKGQKAIIILDQLDALRWTQANSSEALTVCMELISQIRYINYARDNKIVIVFVCREYDLHNDNNISALFKTGSDNKSGEEWKKVVVNEFDETVVKKVVGSKYNNLNLKLKRLLRVPSNLFIWQHLDKNETGDECNTTSHLIEKWYQQICKKSIQVGVQEKVVQETLDYIVEVLDRIGRLYAPVKIIKAEQIGLDYLVYSEMIVIDESRVGFVHQSILDYFISTRMMQQFYEGIHIEKIIGPKNKQSPSKRYQVQMFLQNLLEFNSNDFLTVGKQMQESDYIRFYVKYVFYEMLGQISEPDKNVVEFILENCRDERCVDYLISNVVYGNHSYIKVLRECGLLEQWFKDEKRKNTVFTLLRSISINLDSQDIAFIKAHSLKNEEDDRNFVGCLLHDIMQESDELFELRMIFYNKYPTLAQELYIDYNSMLKHCEKRTIKLISFWVKNKITSKGKNVYHYEEELVNENDSCLLENGKYVLNELLQYVPKDDSMNISYGDWSGRFLNKQGIERAAVRLIEKANKAIITQNPDMFWEYYKPYMGKNYIVYNEIILYGLQYMPSIYSNKVIEYLSSDINKTMFDYTSGADEQLGLAKEVIKVHTAKCDEENLRYLENAITKYISPRAVEWYNRRMDQNRTKEYAPVYWPFWGDLQYHLLRCIPLERLSKQSKNLLNVLERKFNGQSYRYGNCDSHSGWVKSPVSGKSIGKKQWLQIITNKNLTTRKHSSWKSVNGGFVESSFEMYSSDFHSAVKNEPELMIKMVLAHKDEIIPLYIDSMYSGAEFSENIEEVKQETWEEMFKTFPCNMESQRASYFTGIIEKSEIFSWSAEVIEQLKDIAINYTGTESEEKADLHKKLECDELVSKSLNCVRGEALRAIGHLLWENKELFVEFKQVIDSFTYDRDAAVQMASFYALWPVYNIDREWSEKKILELYESDIRMAGFQDSKSMFFRLYPKYKERVLSVIMKCFQSQDKRLIQVGGYSICEFFIRYNEFEEVISNIDVMSEEQVNSILSMATLYFKYDEYRDIGKAIILKYKNSNFDVEFSLGRIFDDRLVDLKRDSDFLIEIMKANVSRRMVYSFVSFLEKNAYSFTAYAKVIITLCKNVLSMNSEELTKKWGIENYISKLIFALYDENVNSEKEPNKDIAEKCLELWDVMFEKQIGQVRDLSHELMDR